MGLFDFKKKSAKPDFASVRSGGSSTAAAPSPSPQPQADGAHTAPLDAGSSAGTTYVVVEGDSLSKIAKRHYGDAKKWRRIYEANRAVISNPDLIHPGQRLQIPV